MTHSEAHIDLTRLSAFLEDDLAAGERRQVAAHLARCELCAGSLARLRDLLAEARRLPDEIDPPAELWTALRARLESPREQRRIVGLSWWGLAAAAVVLVALTATVTTLLVRRPAMVVTERSEVPASPAVMSLVGPARAVDANYAATIRQLNDALAQHRAELDPATVAKVEASLRVIDDAIGEARRALAADPANLTLLDILAANYQRKLELLQRANELPHSI